MISPVRSHGHEGSPEAVQGRRSIKVGRIGWKGRRRANSIMGSQLERSYDQPVHCRHQLVLCTG